MRRYGRWAGNSYGLPENNASCIIEVAEPGRWIIHYHQCSRKRGYGPDELYCKQHAKMIESGWEPYIPKEKP